MDAFDRAWDAACRDWSVLCICCAHTWAFWNLSDLLVGDEGVAECLVRPQPSVRIPSETLANKVQESFVVTLETCAQGLAARSTSPAFTGNSDSWLHGRVEKQLASRRLLNNVSRRWSEDLHDAGQLLLFVLTRKDWIPSVELGKNAAKAPHVDSETIFASKNDFWAAIEARLDVRIHLFISLAGTAKVYYSYVCSSGIAK